MRIKLIDTDLLRVVISVNTDADLSDAGQIINMVLLQQRGLHGEKCNSDVYAKDVCEGMYTEKCNDVNGLCEALRAVLALAGESEEVRHIIEQAIAEHG
jgi:hypothetical protein